MLTAFYLSTFKPEGNECCHVNVVILDSGNTPAQHAQCHITHAAHFLEISNITGLFALLFFFNQDLWSWIVARLYHSMLSVILHLLHKFKCSFFVWGHALWPRNPIYTGSQCCIEALSRHITNFQSEIRILAVGHTMSNAPDLF